MWLLFLSPSLYKLCLIFMKTDHKGQTQIDLMVFFDNVQIGSAIITGLVVSIVKLSEP